MDLPDIIYRKTPPLATISMDRPETKNAFTLPMMESICRALRASKEDPDIKVIILTGEGGAFSAGANVKDAAEGKLTSWNMKDYLWNHIQRVPLLLEDIDKPVIAAIDGPAIGGAFDVTLACDLRVASERATLGATFVRLGILPGDGGAQFLPRLVGLSKALEILLSGRVIKADEALRIGLVNRVLPVEGFLDGVKGYAMEIAQWPLAGLRATKRAVYNGLKSDLRGHLDYVSSQIALLTEREEHLEIMKKLVKKK